MKEDFNIQESLPSASEPITDFALSAPDPVLINVSGKDTEPLWVDPYEVAAVGLRGEDSSLIVLKGSGTQLVAKGTHPNEVAQAVCGVPSIGRGESADPEGD